MSRLFSTLSWLVLASMMSIVLIIGFWMIYPYRTIEFKSGVDEKTGETLYSADLSKILPHKISSTIVESGAHITYEVTYCKYTNVTPIITRYFVDGVSYLISDNQIASYKPKGCGVTKIKTYIPKALALDKMKIEIIYRYQVNPLRTVTITTYTEAFTIE